MAQIHKGKWAAELDGDFVVFLIGARPSVRHPLAWFRDLGGRRGMKHMLDRLTADPDSGLLGYTMGFPVIVQYWRSFEHLEAFAADTGEAHPGAEKTYWQRVSRHGHGAGIWHETFLVKAGQYEAVYGNMPAFGLGAARGGRLHRATNTARERLRAAGAEPV
ncbi:monooxygenase family protein [Amycolatopsis alkalitolerans]|uniref:DUF4188 domain-containing protein n=1 Tax=Amycolatopsis alkalitolerans TaxID=2547244 RepID=A0A5C4LTZ7_9PSEU|nr:DUF4188 domain-containing protein [Amycolatopsis alkalitolerans]TNC22122.1 DUF4188 domain-containing protein [Amycolatopsis alkalitolerans]